MRQQARTLGGWGDTGLGLTDLQTSGVYRWLDGTTATFTSWAPNEPQSASSDGHCVQLNDDDFFRWEEDHCSDKAHMACQAILPPEEDCLDVDRDGFGLGCSLGPIATTVTRSAPRGGLTRPPWRKSNRNRGGSRIVATP